MNFFKNRYNKLFKIIWVKDEIYKSEFNLKFSKLTNFINWKDNLFSNKFYNNFFIPLKNITELYIYLLNFKDDIIKKNITFEFIENLFYHCDKKNYLPIYILLFKFMNFLIYIYYNYLSIYIKKNYLLICIKYLKLSNILQFKILIDLVVIDSIKFFWKKRFKLVYQLFSLKYNNRLFLNTFIDIKENISSLYLLFPNSNWLEREAWDLFGLVFINHPDLRRILTDYGFKGYPLRKDFPVSGYVELWYDDRIQDIKYKPIKLMQEMRFYNFVNNWENLL